MRENAKLTGKSVFWNNKNVKKLQINRNNEPIPFRQENYLLIRKRQENVVVFTDKIFHQKAKTLFHGISLSMSFGNFFPSFAVISKHILQLHKLILPLFERMLTRRRSFLYLIRCVLKLTINTDVIFLKKKRRKVDFQGLAMNIFYWNSGSQ